MRKIELTPEQRESVMHLCDVFEIDPRDAIVSDWESDVDYIKRKYVGVDENTYGLRGTFCIVPKKKELKFVHTPDAVWKQTSAPEWAIKIPYPWHEI